VEDLECETLVVLRFVDNDSAMLDIPYMERVVVFSRLRGDEMITVIYATVNEMYDLELEVKNKSSIDVNDNPVGSVDLPLF
jgi:hypothetical protein